MKKTILFFFIMSFFLTIGCIDNNVSSAPTSTSTPYPTQTPTQTPVSTIVQTPTSNPTPDNVLRLYEKTINNDIYFQIVSICTPLSINLKEGDKVEVSIIKITGGNGNVDFSFGEEGTARYLETHVSREGTNSFTVPHDGRYILFFEKDINDETYREFEYEVTINYIDTKERYYKIWDLQYQGCG